jgi:outer membrane protein OmpA-like peptidoglycan-associated protein
VDIKTAGNSIVDARESIALARGEGGPEHAPQEFARAESLLKEAQESLRKGKNRDAADLAFQADVEAKIATALAREVKAKRRAEEVRESKIKITWEVRTDELAAAKARRAIAEKMALEAQKEAEKVKAQADKEIQRARIELTIARAELEMDLADQRKASEYAKESYSKARSSLQAARSALAADDLQKAATAAEEAVGYTSDASVQARAKLEVEMEESLRRRDRAVSAITKAEVLLEGAKKAVAVIQYTEDIYEKAEKMLREARLALEAKEYDRAGSLAEQAHGSASSAQAVAEAREREIQAREDREDIKANALDAVAKAERTLAEAYTAGAEELVGDIYDQAQAALDRARQVMLEENFEEALSLARESISHSVAALAMAKAKAERRRKIEEIESNIMEEAGKVPETSVRRTNRGVVISMGGALFAQGSSQIRNDARARLTMVAELLKIYSDYKIVIEGHTDSVGSEEANLEISSERAYNFLRYMVDREDIPLERLSSVGYGESRPIASNINEAGRRQNRRVDIVILTAPVSP